MAVKFPDKIKIGGHWYKIDFPYHFKERGDTYGQHDGDLLSIRVDDRDGYSHDF